MRNTFLKTIGAIALTILMLATFAPSSVFAQEENGNYENGSQTEQEELTRRESPRALEGSWNVQVTIRNCQTNAVITTFAAMNTFMRGGTLQETGTGMPPNLRAPGHGVWSHRDRRTFAAAFQFFRFNPDGSYAGIQRVRRTIEVSRFGSGFTATANVEILNPSGALVATACATETAARFE